MKSGVSGVFRYLALASPRARPPKPTSRPRWSVIGNIKRWRKRSKGRPPSSGVDGEAGLDLRGHGNAPGLERPDHGVPAVWRVADGEARLQRFGDTAPLQIVTRDPAGGRRQLLLKPASRRLVGGEQRVDALGAGLGLALCCARVPGCR